MTKAQALAEARRRWGPFAIVFRLPNGTHRVRAERGAVFYKEAGEGISYDAAFADADRREKGEGT